MLLNLNKKEDVMDKITNTESKKNKVADAIGVGLIVVIVFSMSRTCMEFTTLEYWHKVLASLGITILFFLICYFGNTILHIFKK
jgi:hypothetical protein